MEFFLKKRKIFIFYRRIYFFIPVKREQIRETKTPFPLLQTIFPGDFYEIVIL